MKKTTTEIKGKLNSLENIKVLQAEALQYLQVSRMKNDEKKMWFAMLPYMTQEQLEKLIGILKKETEEVANLYISLLA